MSLHFSISSMNAVIMHASLYSHIRVLYDKIHLGNTFIKTLATLQTPLAGLPCFSTEPSFLSGNFYCLNMHGSLRLNNKPRVLSFSPVMCHHVTDVIFSFTIKHLLIFWDITQKKFAININNRSSETN